MDIEVTALVPVTVGPEAWLMWDERNEALKIKTKQLSTFLELLNDF